MLSTRSERILDFQSSEFVNRSVHCLRIRGDFAFLYVVVSNPAHPLVSRVEPYPSIFKRRICYTDLDHVRHIAAYVAIINSDPVSSPSLRSPEVLNGISQELDAGDVLSEQIIDLV